MDCRSGNSRSSRDRVHRSRANGCEWNSHQPTWCGNPLLRDRSGCGARIQPIPKPRTSRTSRRVRPRLGQFQVIIGLFGTTAARVAFPTLAEEENPTPARPTPFGRWDWTSSPLQDLTGARTQLLRRTSRWVPPLPTSGHSGFSVGYLGPRMFRSPPATSGTPMSSVRGPLS